MFELSPEWHTLLLDYKKAHSHRYNQLTHMVGIPMILSSFPLLLAMMWAPAAALFVVGWAFQFLGHYFEGNDPAFFGDRRNLLIGAIWWFQKVGIPLVRIPSEG